MPSWHKVFFQEFSDWGSPSGLFPVWASAYSPPKFLITSFPFHIGTFGTPHIGAYCLLLWQEIATVQKHYALLEAFSSSLLCLVRRKVFGLVPFHWLIWSMGLVPSMPCSGCLTKRPSVKLYTLFFHSTNTFCASTLYYSRHRRYCREQKKSLILMKLRYQHFLGMCDLIGNFLLLCGCQFVEIFAVHIIYLKIFNIIFNNCKNSLLTVLCCL